MVARARFELATFGPPGACAGLRNVSPTSYLEREKLGRVGKQKAELVVRPLPD